MDGQEDFLSSVASDLPGQVGHKFQNHPTNLVTTLDVVIEEPSSASRRIKYLVPKSWFLKNNTPAYESSRVYANFPAK